MARSKRQQIGRRQVDGDAPERKLEPGVEQRAADPVLALLHRRLGQANDGQPRQAVGQVYLDGHERRLDPDLGAAVDDGDGHGGWDYRPDCDRDVIGASSRWVGGAHGLDIGPVVAPLTVRGGQ
jgi:hypothetical protein